jgi:photosystem II stability/assembly factor-like uncharacterized protein
LISHTTDGGQTWQTWKGGPGCDWYKAGGLFAFTGLDKAWSICIPTNGGNYIDPMYLRKSTDGGQTWNDVYSTEPNKGVGSGIASIYGLFFLDDDKSWVSTVTRSHDLSSQTIVRTTQNGGRSWNTLAGFDSGLYDLRFTSATIGYGLSGAILLGTTDGGNTWAQLYGEPVAPRHFKFFDAQNGVGISTAADLGAVSHTTDGGYTWKPTDSLKGSCGQGVMSRVLDISFPNSRDGWVLLDCRDRQGDGQERVLMRSTDSGATWRSVQTHNLPPEAQGRSGSVSFVDAKTGYIGSVAEGLQVTHDGGVTFTKIPTKLPDTYPEGLSIHFVTTDTGWLVGFGTWATTDGGMSWKLTFAGHVDRPVFDMLTDGHIWVSNRVFTGVNNYSTCGLLSKGSNSTTWTARRLGVCPAEISFADDMHGWLRDTSNYLYSTTDGGDTWAQLP